MFQQGWTTGALLFEKAAVCNGPASLAEKLSAIPKWERPASPLTDYTDSWFGRLLSIRPLNGTASDDIVVSDDANAYIESRPGGLSHPRNTLFNNSVGELLAAKPTSRAYRGCICKQKKILEGSGKSSWLGGRQQVCQES